MDRRDYSLRCVKRTAKPISMATDMRRMTRSLTRFTALPAVAGMLLIAAGSLAAHDFWIVPNAFQVTPGDTIRVYGQTSSRFPTSESAVAVDRVADARILGASGESRISNLSIAGKSLRLDARPATAGQYVVAVTLNWRSMRESAESFKRYLGLEGAPAALERIEREGLLAGKDSITRRYAKYAKTLVDVGTGGARAFARVAGHPLEFVPETDPAGLRAGDTLSVRLLFAGKPAAAADVHAGAVEWSGGALPDQPRETAKDVDLVSDANGVIRIPISAAGLWNVRTIHIAQSPARSGGDWDAHWATLVFLVGGPARAAAAVPGDSADVARIVDAYDHALRAGDTTGALALLLPDVTILESGGTETREEYRSHHLASDMEYARAVPAKRSAIQVRVRGDVAWAWSTTVSQGTFRERPVNSAGAELMVLTRTPQGWRISAIHWSSRTRRP